MELLVVIGIIAILISLLLPALAKAREQARYVRWQAFSRDQAMDPNIILEWNFQNDRGSGNITNIAANNQDDPSFNPGNFNAVIYEGLNNANITPLAITNPTSLKEVWANDGRFRGKPSLTFSGTGVNPDPNIYPVQPSDCAKMGKLLVKSQQITIMMWVNVPQSVWSQEGPSSLLFWGPGINSPNPRALNIHMPDPSGMVYFDTYSQSSGNGFDRAGTPDTFANGTNWQLWVFTKNARAGTQKIYLNGQLQGFSTSPATGLFGPFQSNNASVGTPNCPFVLGVWPGIANRTGQIDELAIFNADLSPSNDVVVSGGGCTSVPGVAAVRFLQMYQMGTN